MAIPSGTFPMRPIPACVHIAFDQDCISCWRDAGAALAERLDEQDDICRTHFLDSSGYGQLQERVKAIDDAVDRLDSSLDDIRTSLTDVRNRLFDVQATLDSGTAQ